MKVALLLLGPLAVLAAIVFVLFGADGPSDSDIRGQALIRLFGMFYGIYLIALSIMWSRRRQRDDRR
jgi:uncharacterized membrane protein